MTNTLNATALADLPTGATYNFRVANGDSHLGILGGVDDGDVTVLWALSWYVGAPCPVELDDDHDAVLLAVDDVTEVYNQQGHRVF